MPHLKKKNKEIKKEDKIKLVDITKIRFSPEFEFELPAKVDADKLIERGKTLKSWELKGDGSLTNGIELSPENSNHLYYNEDSLMQIKEILALCRVYKAKALPSCGLHLHINVKNLSDKDVLNIIREWIHRQKFIAKRFNISKERLSETCKFLPKSDYKLTEKVIHQYRNKSGYSFSGYSSLDEKYRSLNISHLPKNDYQTLEFRMFSSTVNFKEIKSIIYFVLTFCQEAIERE
jgi:hypothetical protein